MIERYGLFRRPRRFAALIALGAGAFSSSAFADGGPPSAYGILFDPGNPSHIIIRSQYWGLFDGHEGASGWSLLCSQAFGGKATVLQNFPAVVAEGGRILVAAAFEGLHMSDDGCTWRTSDAFSGSPQFVSIAPLDASRTGFVLVTVLGVNGGTNSRVHLSADRGDTWTETEGKLLLDFSVMDVAVAPSDPDRIYVVGVMVDGGPRMIGTSTDGGASWAMLPVGAPDQYAGAASSHLSVAGIDPAHPDTLFVRADGADDPPTDDELWASSDAGKTWVKAYASSGDMAGFAFSADGKRVFIGGIAEGIKVAPIEDAVAGKSGVFRAVFNGKVWGLGMNAGKLYAGMDDFGMKPPFMLGVSTDEGATFAPVMNHCEVSFPTCAASSTMELVCREQWERVGGYVYDLLDEGKGCDDRIARGGAAGAAGAPATTSGGATDVVSGGAPSVASGGSAAVAAATPGSLSIGQSCDCSLGRARSSIPFSTIVLVAGTAAGVGLRRRRRS